MSPATPKLRGILRKRINLANFGMKGLHLVFGFTPPEADKAYISNEKERRWAELDRIHGLSSDHPDIWEHRANSLAQQRFVGFHQLNEDGGGAPGPRPILTE